MTCSHPLTLRAGVGRKKRLDVYGLMPSIKVPCGHCMPCRIQRAREWAQRIVYEMPYHGKSCFITLTYDNEHFSPSLNPSDLQGFWKRLRERFPDRKLKYLACGEYGDKGGRPHFHAILFGVSLDSKLLKNNLGSFQSELLAVEKSWTYGQVFIGCVTYESARYVSGYVLKKAYGKTAPEVYGDLLPPKIFCSKGIGEKFLYDNYDRILADGYLTFHGVKTSLPRYFLKLIYKRSPLDYGNLMRRFEVLKSESISDDVEHMFTKLQLISDDFKEDFKTFSESCRKIVIDNGEIEEEKQSFAKDARLTERQKRIERGNL